MIQRLRKRLHRFRKRLRDHWFYRVAFPFYLLRTVRRGDVVIDCGANVGEFTERFSQFGAVVYAFEPHPEAFRILEERFRGRPNVHLFNQAVANKAGHLKLFLRIDSDSVAAIESSSLMEEKDNISTDDFIYVEAVRFVDVIKEIGAVKLVKMDIEGAEYDVLTDVIDAGVHQQVEQFLVETHERNPGLMDRHVRLTSRIKGEGIRNIDLTWH